MQVAFEVLNSINPDRGPRGTLLSPQSTQVNDTYVWDQLPIVTVVLPVICTPIPS